MTFWIFPVAIGSYQVFPNTTGFIQSFCLHQYRTWHFNDGWTTKLHLKICNSYILNICIYLFTKFFLRKMIRITSSRCSSISLNYDVLWFQYTKFHYCPLTLFFVQVTWLHWSKLSKYNAINASCFINPKFLTDAFKFARPYIGM